MQQFISTYGYLAVFVLMLAESACIPIPSELTMPFAGALAAGAVAGIKLNLALVILTGLAGNLAGSYLAWAVGLVGGQAAARRWGRYLGGPHGIERAQRWFDRYGGRTVFFGRMLPVIRTFISLPAGFAKMRWLRFGVYTAAGCLPWIAGLAWAGYAAGSSWQRVSSAMREPTYVVAGVVAVLVIVGVVLAIRARRRARAAVRPEPQVEERQPERPSSARRS